MLYQFEWCVNGHPHYLQCELPILEIALLRLGFAIASQLVHLARTPVRQCSKVTYVGHSRSLLARVVFLLQPVQMLHHSTFASMTAVQSNRVASKLATRAITVAGKEPVNCREHCNIAASLLATIICRLRTSKCSRSITELEQHCEISTTATKLGLG